MLDSDENYCLTLDQKSISVLLNLRGSYLSAEDVLSVKNDITYDEAMKIANKCNEKLLEIKRCLIAQCINSKDNV